MSDAHFACTVPAVGRLIGVIHIRAAKAIDMFFTSRFSTESRKTPILSTRSRFWTRKDKK